MKGSKGFDLLTIQQYLDGKLDPKQMHQLEKEALNDPFLADALEGYSHAKKPVLTELSILQKQLEQRIAIQQDNKDTFNFTWQRLSIAAAAGLMFITVGILFWMSTQNKDVKTASAPKKVNVELTPGLDKTENTSPQATIKAKEENIPEVVNSAPRISQNIAKKAIPQSLPEQTSVVMQMNGNIAAQNEPITNIAVNGKEVFGRNAPASPAAISSPPLGQLAVQSMAVSNSISGKVIDQTNRQALPGVSVRVKGTNIVTQTDSKGEFTLPDTVKGTINLSYLGYQQKEININPGERLAIVLNQDQTALNEVVVVGSGVQKKVAPSSISEVSGAQPATGWDSYRTYLEENLKYPKSTNVSGDVIVGFTIDSRGRPTNIHIIQGLNGPCDTEAMRLIRQGPLWEIIDPNKPSQVRVTINFHP